MATYKLVYGDAENQVTETLNDITDVEREDGWVVLFRGKEAVSRLRAEHVVSLDEITV